MMAEGNAAVARNHANMAYLAARTCGMMNGVSRLHGGVSQGFFQDLYPHQPKHEVPVSYVTNGVHVPSWDSPWADRIWTLSCGKARWLGTNTALIQEIESLEDEALWNFRGQERTDLVHHARQRLRLQMGQRSAELKMINQVGQALDPNRIDTRVCSALFSPYKRPNLLLHEPERLARLLTQKRYPVQIIVAGKAHPADKEGKKFIQQWAQFADRFDVWNHAVFLEDYDIALAQEMVQGIDVWINTPNRPMEASGTSGMKVLVNGGLNLSELDGWWAEAYTPEVGWALGDGQEHHEPDWDDKEAEQLYRLLEDELVPMFYDRDASGIPRARVTRVRASMGRLTPQFSTNRMEREYVEKLYLPSAAIFHHRTTRGEKVAKKLFQWDLQLKQHWLMVHWGNLMVSKEKSGWTFEVQIYLGEIHPDSVQVQLYADTPAMGAPVYEAMQRCATIPGSLSGYLYQCKIQTNAPTPILRLVLWDTIQMHSFRLNIIKFCAGRAQLSFKIIRNDLRQNSY
jgi:glycogen phosphorylase